MNQEISETRSHVTCWVNGLQAEVISVYDRGLAYGHGLFETILVVNGEAPLLERHLARLERGVKVLTIPVNRSDLVAFCGQALQQLAGCSGVLKLILTAGEGQRGYGPGGDMQPTCILQFHEGVKSRNTRSRGLSLAICEQRLARNPALAGIKHLNRLEQVLAASQLQASDYIDGVMLDEHQHIVETVSQNLFVHIDDGWLTPDLENCGVTGVMRDFLLERVFPQLGLSVVVGDLPLPRLSDVAEAFVCNAIHGISPVIAIGNDWSKPVGMDTEKIIATLGEMLPCFRA